MCSVEEFMGGSCFGGLCLLGGGHFAGSSYNRCCLALSCSESHRSRSNKLAFADFHVSELPSPTWIAKAQGAFEQQCSDLSHLRETPRKYQLDEEIVKK